MADGGADEPEWKTDAGVGARMARGLARGTRLAGSQEAAVGTKKDKADELVAAAKGSAGKCASKAQ
eukprot:4981722-Pyramimonas_sp.AAC.1